MTTSDRAAAGREPSASAQPSARSKRQLIGVLLTVYGATLAAVLLWIGVFARQGSDARQPWLAPTLVALSVPCCVGFVGQGLARDRLWAYWAALLLPIAVIPVSAVWIMNPRGTPDALWVHVFGPVGSSAFFALGTVPLSVVLLRMSGRRTDGP